MFVNNLSIEKIENYDPLNNRARADGMVTEWVGRNEWGNSKAECIKEARKYKVKNYDN